MWVWMWVLDCHGESGIRGDARDSALVDDDDDDQSDMRTEQKQILIYLEN